VIFGTLRIKIVCLLVPQICGQVVRQGGRDS